MGPTVKGLRKFRAAILFFDNDGTIFDSSSGVLEAVQDGFREFTQRHGLELAPPTIERIKELTGKPNTVFFPSLLPPESAKMAPELRSICLKHEVRAIHKTGRLYPGAEHLLQELRARKKLLVLMTNSGEKYLHAIAGSFGYEKLFHRLYHVDLYGLQSERITHALRAFRLNGTPLAVVGDKAEDMRTGRKHNATTVFAAYGFGGSAERELADFVIRDPLDLLHYID